MKSNTIYLPRHNERTQDTRNNLIRVDFDVLDELNCLAYKTAMSKKELISLLLRDALSRVELVERKVYELRMQEQEEEASPDD